MSNFALNFNMFCDMIDQIIDYNKDFVARKGYEKYLTDKYLFAKLRKKQQNHYICTTIKTKFKFCYTRSTRSSSLYGRQKACNNEQRRKRYGQH